MKRITLKRYRDINGGKVYDMTCGERRVIVCLWRRDIENNRPACAARLRKARAMVRGAV